MNRKPSPYALGSNQYAKKYKTAQPVKEPTVTLKAPTGYQMSQQEQKQHTKLTWDESQIDTTQIRHSTPQRALHRFKKSLTNIVWNTASLEGNNFTEPEVRTLLEDKISVAGHTQHEVNQVLALGQAYNQLANMIETNRFTLNKQTSDQLHKTVAIHEALEAGNFRGEKHAQGGGHVSLSDGNRVEGYPPGPGGTNLIAMHQKLRKLVDNAPDPRLGAILYFATATRHQYYFDGNKRTARLMMTGHLITNGHDPVNIPYNRRLEFNQALDTLFKQNEATDLMSFLTTCTL